MKPFASLLVCSCSVVAVCCASFAATIGTEGFTYPDGPIAGQTGGVGWDYDNVAKSHTGTMSDWDNVGGAPQVQGGALVTNNSSAKREYNGPGEGSATGSDERIGALQGTGVVYYRVSYTQVAGQDWSGISSYDFGAERLFFGQPGGQGGTKYFGLAQQVTGVSTVPIVPGRTYDLVAEVNFDADVARLFVDPLSNPEPAIARRYTATNWSTAVRLGSGGQTAWDNLVVATKWSDLGLPKQTGLLSYEPLAGYAPGSLAGQAH